MSQPGIARRRLGVDRRHLDVVQVLDVVLLGRRVPPPLLGEHVDDDRARPLGRVGQRLLETADVVAVDRSDVADPERLEERVRGDDLAQGTGQSVDAGVGELAHAGQVADDRAQPLTRLHVGGAEAEMRETQRQLRHGRGVRAAVVVEDDDHPLARVAEIVERLVGHATGQGAVAHHGHDPPVAALQLEGGRHAVGIARGRPTRGCSRSSRARTRCGSGSRRGRPPGGGG